MVRGYLCTAEPNFCVEIEWETLTFLKLLQLSAMSTPKSTTWVR